MGPYLLRSDTNEKIEFGDQKKFKIGRCRTSDLRIPEEGISKDQCIFTYWPRVDNWIVTDLSSSKSTRVNEVKVPNIGKFMITANRLSFADAPYIEYIFHKNDFRTSSQPAPPKSERPRLNNNEGITNPRELVRMDDLAEKLSSLEEQNATLRTKKSSMWRELKTMKNKFKTLEDERVKIANEFLLNQVVTEEFRSDLASSSLEIEVLAGERDRLAMELEKSEAIPRAADNDGEIEALQRDLLQTKKELRESNAKLELNDKEKKVLIDALVDIIEQELMCCVCNEVIFQPVVMNCKHTVCRQCLDQWKRSKKECPECRTRIKIETQPLMFDRLIDRVAPLLSADFMKTRQDVKKERLSPSIVGLASPVRRTAGEDRDRFGDDLTVVQTVGVVDLTLS